MGKRGPPPKPSEQKKMEGTYREDRDAGRDAVVTVPGSPLPPKELSAEATAIWNQVVPELLSLGTLAKTDGGVLAGYCMTLTRAIELDALAKTAPLIDNPPYGKKLNPAGIEARKLWPVVQKLAVDLGLSYAARSRVKMPEKSKSDPAEAFLFGEKPELKVLAGGRAPTAPAEAGGQGRTEASARRDAAVEAAILAEAAKGSGSGSALAGRAGLNKAAALAACKRLVASGRLERKDSELCLPTSGSSSSGTEAEPPAGTG